MVTIGGEEDYENVYNATGIVSRHFTIIFNAFVMMTIFNFLNCRKLKDEINIFAGITHNPLFIIIVIIIFALQAILITFTGSAFHVYSKGLAWQQWLICIAIGFGSLPVNLLLKIHYIPEPAPALKDPNQNSEEEVNSGV